MVIRMKENSRPDVRPVDESKTGEHDLVFYYSREHRLKKASRLVRSLYENVPVRRFGFFTSLVDTKPKAMLLIVIVAVCLLCLFLPVLRGG
ncbi:MAG: hypothetical protein LBD86_02425 [Spirochaetaceae bacterium]|jgi:hypothetical protein|nr:hypothetical protein [Spirochaetaceae bacterium]